MVLPTKRQETKNKTKMHLGGIGMTSDRQTENGRTSASGNVTRCVCYFSSAKPTTKRRKANLFCSLVFSVPLSDVTPVLLVLPGGSSSGSGGGAVYKRPSHTHRLTQKFKVGGLPPAQVLGNNGFFYFFYLLLPILIKAKIELYCFFFG